MSYYFIDLETMWKGVGPAGKLFRIISIFAVAEALCRKVVFSSNTQKWWGTILKPFENPDCKGQEKIIEKDPIKGLKEGVNFAPRRDQLVKKYAKKLIVPNKKVRERVFKIKKKLGDKYICIHIRGTDKVTERLYLPPTLHLRLLKKALEVLPKAKVVVVTDSEYFFQWFLKEHPVEGTDCLRSKNETPLHLHKPATQQEKMLEDCLVDFFVMAGAAKLIYTPSMMATLSTKVAPELQRYSVESLIDERERQILTDATEYIRHFYYKWTAAARKTGYDFI